jgi:hypothetical protein
VEFLQERLEILKELETLQRNYQGQEVPILNREYRTPRLSVQDWLGGIFRDISGALWRRNEAVKPRRFGTRAGQRETLQ